MHACRRLSDKLGYSNEFAMLQLDFANALNIVSRPAFLRVVRTRFPEIYGWFNYRNGSASLPRLWCDEES